MVTLYVVIEYLDVLEDVGVDGGLIRAQELGAEEGEEEVRHDGQARHLSVSAKMFLCHLTQFDLGGH